MTNEAQLAGALGLEIVHVSERHLESAIRSSKNSDWALESANKEYKTHIIISDATRLELGEAAHVNSLGTIVVKGKTVGVEIFELTALAG